MIDSENVLEVTHAPNRLPITTHYTFLARPLRGGEGRGEIREGEIGVERERKERRIER